MEKCEHEWLIPEFECSFSQTEGLEKLPKDGGRSYPHLTEKIHQLLGWKHY